MWALRNGAINFSTRRQLKIHCYLQGQGLGGRQPCSDAIAGGLVIYKLIDLVNLGANSMKRAEFSP